MADELQERRAARHKMMTEDPLGRVILIIAVPTVLSMLIEAIYNLADTFFVSQLGMAATAAVGVNDSLMHVIMSLAMGFGMGASSYISRLLGAKDNEMASRTGTTALFTTMMVGVVFSIFAFTFMDKLVMFLGATETSKKYAIDYATYILLVCPVTCANMIFSQLLRADGSTKYSAVGDASGCILNCILDPIFIRKFGLGVAGAAMATALSKCVSFCILIYPFLKKRCIVEIKFKYFTPKWAIYKEIARMGIPSFLRSVVMSFSSILVNNIAGGYGDHVLAAMSVGNKCMRFVGSAVMGYGMGFQPIAGYCYGAKKYRRVFKAFWFCTLCGCASAVVIGGLLIIFARNVIGIFTTADASAVVDIGAFLIRTQCAMLPFHLWVMLVGGIYQALGHAVGSTIVGLSRQVIFFIPCVIVMNLIAGEYGLASAQAVADLLTMAMGVPMFLHIRKQVLKEEAAYLATPEGQASLK